MGINHIPLEGGSSGSFAPPVSVKPVVRVVPALQDPNLKDILIEYISSGKSYDVASVDDAVQAGNTFFECGEFARALNSYGIAYEIYRLQTQVYFPLAHDLVLRRSLCYSQMGNFLVALEEVNLALKILPNAPSTLVVRGMICSKLGRIDEANLAFQKAVSQDPDQRDLCECVVAMFNHIYGHYDRAVQIASKVLERCPNHPLALLIRADSYKYHNSGYFAQQAASDYSKLLGIDAAMQKLLGKGFNLQQHARVDELLLQFHPKLSQEGPRMLALYPMRAKRRPLFFVGLLFFVVGRLRTMVRSTRLLRSVFKQQEELQQKRAEAEQKMQQLIEVQRQVSMLESNNEVWGPADPDHMLVKKYRRLWLERPVNFPMRKDSPVSAHAKSSAPSSPVSVHAKSATSSPRNAAAQPNMSLGPSLSDQELLFGIPAPPPPHAFPVPPPMQAAAHIPQAQPHPGMAPREPRSPELERLAAELATVKPREQQAAAHTCEPLTAIPFDSPFGQRDSAHDELSGSLHHVMTPGPKPMGACPTKDGASEPFVLHSSPKFGAGPQDASSAPHFGSASPEPIQQKFKDDVMGITLERSSVTKPLPGYTGSDWNEDQWIRKALEIAEAFIAEEEGWGLKTNLSDPPGARPDSPKATLSPRTPPAVSRGVLKHGDTEVPLLAHAEDSGLDVIPDWYLALDRIYETTNMVTFCTPPIPVCADKMIVNSPGHSYAVGKRTVVSKQGHNYTAPPRPPAASARPFGVVTAPAANRVASTGRMPVRATTPTQRPRSTR